MEDYWTRNNLQKPQSYIVCAAIKKGDRVICGARHFDHIMRQQINASEGSGFWKVGTEQGFINQFGEFLDREEAWFVAQSSNQIKRECYDGQDSTLYSENLY